MIDPLEGIRLKRERAWNQINRLKPKITTFIESDPYVPRVEFYRKSAQEHIVVWAEIRRKPDPVWSVLIGEITHNLRCCLDYLTYGMYVRKHRQFSKSRVQFPIFMSQKWFERKGVKEFLPGLDESHIDSIRSEQPFPKKYGGTGEGGKSPLWHLHELSNADKHRAIQLTGALVKEYRITLPKAAIDFSYVEIERAEVGPIQKDAVLCRGMFVKPPLFQDGDIQGHLAVDVAFDDGVPAVGGWLVDETLDDMANRTDRILRRFFKEVWDTDL